MRVTIGVPQYLPGYKGGGPIRSISNLVSRLGEELSFHVVTSDRDLGDSRPYDSITERWQKLGNAEVSYLAPSDLTAKGVVQRYQEPQPDVIYLNSFFNRPFTVMPLLQRRMGALGKTPVIIAPRGEFGEGACSIKPLRKWAYLKFAKSLGVMEGVIWHATGKPELDDIRRIVGQDATVMIAPNLSDVSQVRPVRSSLKAAGTLRLVFLSRISPKKNLKTAIRILGQLQSQVKFDIYGPLESSSYWEECRAAIKSLPGNISVEYLGEVAPSDVGATLAKYDAFLFPTLNENFGHVIAESLLAGCPVVISDQTPWRDLQQRGVGWDLPLGDESAFVGVLQSLANMSASEHVAMSERSAEYGLQVADNSSTLEAVRRLFLEAAAQKA